MTYATDIVVLIRPYLEDCPPWDVDIDQATLAEIAEDIFTRFDFTPIFNQIDELACAILRERGLSSPTAGES
jgi:hypothetical protein